jgi:hypothetical protein
MLSSIILFPSNNNSFIKTTHIQIDKMKFKYKKKTITLQKIQKKKERKDVENVNKTQMSTFETLYLAVSYQ